MNSGSFFEYLRENACRVITASCNENRLAVDLASATVINLEGFSFLVRFIALTPGGTTKLIFVKVTPEKDEKHGEHLVFSTPFCNLVIRMRMELFRAVWNAPRPKSQAQVVGEAIYNNLVRGGHVFPGEAT